MMIEEGVVQEPAKDIYYGVPGVGKSYNAANYEGATFFDLEGGSHHLNVRRIKTDENKLPATYEEFSALLREVDESIPSLVIDTADALNGMIEDYLCRSNQWADIAAAGYGRGPEAVKSEWRKVLSRLDRLRARGTGIVFLAHSTMVKVQKPDGIEYDQVTLSLPKKVWPLLVGWADNVLFAHYEEEVREVKNRNIGRHTGRRLLQARESASYVAKNRYGMPEVIPFDWETIQRYRQRESVEDVFERKVAGHESETKIREWVAKQNNKNEAMEMALRRLENA